MKKDLHVVSFSGGKDSTAMLLRMMELGMQIDVVLYCDTWMEFPAMYRHVAKIKKIVADAGIKFVELKNPQSYKYFMLEYQPKRRKSTQEKLNGNPKGYTWASGRCRWCTTKLKTELIRAYKKELKSKYNVVEYVGIAADEQYRLERESNKRHRHPLVDWGWDEKTCLRYCYAKGFDWEGLYELFHRVSCWCCPLQSLEELRKLRNKFPDLWEELKDMDSKTWGTFRPDYSVEQLEFRFDFEEKRLSKGKSITSQEFYRELKSLLHKREETNKHGMGY